MGRRSIGRLQKNERIQFKDKTKKAILGIVESGFEQAGMERTTAKGQGWVLVSAL